MINKDFELFKKSIYKWLDYFGLKKWDVSLFYEEYDMESNANIVWNYSNKIVSFYLNPNLDKDEDIDKLAFHEVVELLLAKLRNYSLNTKYVISDEEVDASIHTVIRTLENTLYLVIKNNQKKEKNKK